MPRGYPTGEVVKQIRRSMARLERLERSEFRLIAERWAEIQRELIARLEKVIDEVQRKGVLTVGQLYQLQRYQTFLQEARDYANQFGVWLTDTVERTSTEWAKLGVTNAINVLDIATARGEFSRLATHAVDQAIFMMKSTNPVGQTIRQRLIQDATGAPLPGVEQRVTKTLINSVAFGWNPRQTARQLEQDFSAGLHKALQITRTEQIRAYRLGNYFQMKNSGVVTAYKRMAIGDVRSCLACIADDGHVYDINEVPFDHVMGRCAFVPIIGEAPEPSWLSGEDWLRAQPEVVQRTILGKTRWEMWSKGEKTLRDFITVKFDPVWGKELRLIPLKELSQRLPPPTPPSGPKPPPRPRQPRAKVPKEPPRPTGPRDIYEGNPWEYTIRRGHYALRPEEIPRPYEVIQQKAVVINDVAGGRRLKVSSAMEGLEINDLAYLEKLIEKHPKDAFVGLDKLEFYNGRVGWELTCNRHGFNPTAVAGYCMFPRPNIPTTIAFRNIPGARMLPSLRRGPQRITEKFSEMVFHHEIGHHVWNVALTETKRRQWWDAITRNPRFDRFTSYSWISDASVARNVRESWAESYAIFIQCEGRVAGAMEKIAEVAIFADVDRLEETFDLIREILFG